MEENIKAIYTRTIEYAQLGGFEEIKKALAIIGDEEIQNKYNLDLISTLEAAEMLINIHADISHDEEDALIAAIILREYAGDVAGELEPIIVKEYGLSHTVFEILDTIIPARDLTEAEQYEYYDNIQTNKLALLAAIGFRAHLVQNLHQFSTWNAHRYIDETKACYYPMCIYGKEHYHELLGAISVLMEKIKSIIELAEIMIRRYETRETELIEDILALREENATIRGIIAKFKADNQNELN